MAEPPSDHGYRTDALVASDIGAYLDAHARKDLDRKSVV